jgi:hypothetical protein
MFEDLEAATDESVAAVYRYLDARYPGSKFILTERSESQWIASTAKHRLKSEAMVRLFLGQRLQNIHDSLKDRWVEIQFTQTTLYGTVEFDERKFLTGYRRYHEQISDYFAGREHDILRLRICDGDSWEGLCNFLGVPVPNRPFPHENAFNKDAPLNF